MLVLITELNKILEIIVGQVGSEWIQYLLPVMFFLIDELTNRRSQRRVKKYRTILRYEKIARSQGKTLYELLPGYTSIRLAKILEDCRISLTDQLKWKYKYKYINLMSKFQNGILSADQYVIEFRQLDHQINEIRQELEKHNEKIVSLQKGPQKFYEILEQASADIDRYNTQLKTPADLRTKVKINLAELYLLK